MSTGSIGSVSFWQQDQNYWQNVQAENQASSANSALITSMGDAVTTKAKGLASIINQEALTRVQNQLQDALKSAIAQTQAASASSSASTSPNGSPATGTGTVPVTANTSLTTLRIPPNTAFTVSDGTNTNTYTSTGTDTVGDLINGLNSFGPTAANAVVYLNDTGNIVVAGTNNNVSVSVGGTFASNIGFGANNNSFQPVAPSTSSSSSSSNSSSTSSSSSNSSNSTSSSSSSLNNATLFNSSSALQTGSTAESLLGNGSLVDLLA
jgi:hypothetical protein